MGDENLTEWPSAVPVKEATDATVIKFIRREIIHPLGPLGKIVSDNSLCFASMSLIKLMR